MIQAGQEGILKFCVFCICFLCLWFESPEILCWFLGFDDISWGELFDI